MTATKPCRRWFQFSLKGLMLLLVVVAVPCGWLKWKMVRKAKERAAVAEIEGVGGTVQYDWQLKMKQLTVAHTGVTDAGVAKL